MGTVCVCGTKAPAQGKPKVSAEQQGKINEATKIVKDEIKNDVMEAVKEAEESEPKEGDEEKPEKTEEQKKEAKRKAKKAKKRLGKLEVLEKAREVEAMTLNDYNTAIRRLHSVTGEDPTNPGQKITLPEGLEWMTAMLEVLWPSIQKYTEKYVLESIQPIITRCVEGMGITCEIERFRLGSNSPAFGPMGARRVAGLDGKKDGGIELNMGITYRSNMSVKIDTSAGNIGVQNIDFLGTLFIWLRPFVDEMPILGGIEMAFVNPPRIELDWTGFVGQSVELTGLQGMVRDIIDSSVASFAVVPNFIAIPMHPSIDPAKLKCPEPEGIMRLTVVGARNLPSSDFGGGCDPFVRVRVGAQTFKTKVVKNTLCPKWGETFDFLVYNKDQWVMVDILDKDMVLDAGGNDLIGSVLHLPVNRIVKRRIAEVPLTKDGLPLIGEDEDGDDYPPCTIQLKAEWVEIRDSEAASADRLVSVHISEVKGIPEALGARYPFTVQASVEGNSQTTKGGAAKPGSWTDSEEVLRIIRAQAGRSVEEIQRMTNLTEKGHKELIEKAIEKSGSSWALEVNESDGAWWKKQSYLLNFNAFGNEKDAEKDDRIIWAGKSEDERVPIASKAELNKRKAFYEIAEKIADWHRKVTAILMKQKASTEPYYEHVMHINATKTEQVLLEILDKDKKVVGKKVLTVKDSAVGDQPDLVGPFDVQLSGKEADGATAIVHGSITVKSCSVTTNLPDNWNLKADSLDSTKEFTLWWKDEKYLEDWHYNKAEGKKWTAVNWPENKKERASEEEIAEREKFYKEGEDKVIGSGVTPTKEAALLACLRAGAVTWGDYDLLLGKLHGEKDVPNIAETLEWVNLMIMAMWPNIKVYSENVIKNTVEPLCSKAARKAGASMKMVELDCAIPKADMGTKPPSFNTIQVQKIRRTNGWGGDYDGMIMILNNVSFVSNIDIEVDISATSSMTGTKVMRVGAKNVIFRGTFKITMGPMLPTMPMIGAMQITMPNPPDISLDFTGLTDALVDKIPGMNSLVTGTVIDSVAAYCCVPNFIVVPLAPKLIKPVELAYPRPIGVLRIVCESALHLEAGDVSITGEKNSDAYVKVRCGSTQFQTDPVTSLNPKWTLKNSKDFVIHDLDQNIEFEVLDADGVFGGSDDSLGAVHSKETVLGGGIDLIQRGIPVRALLRLGAKACLGLSRKKKDEVSSSDDHVVFESILCKGVDGQESKLIIAPTWLNIINDGNRNLAYLLSFQLDEIRGIPSGIDVNLNGPFKVRASVGPHNIISKAGAAKSGAIADASELLKTVRRMGAAGDNAKDIAKILQIDVALVDEALMFKEQEMVDGQEKVVFWCENALGSIQKHKSVVNPHFLQRLHEVIPIDRDNEPAQLGRWKCPILVEILNTKGDPIASTTVEYDVQSQYNAEEQTAGTIFGPFTVNVDTAAKEAGMLASVGMGGYQQDAYTGTWQIFGNVQLEGLKQRIMDAD